MQTPDRASPDIPISEISRPEDPLLHKVSSFKEGIFDSLPLAIDYVPISFAFGLNSVKLGFTPSEAIFFSCVIYAGASQFVITALPSAGMSLWVSALTVTMIWAFAILARMVNGCLTVLLQTKSAQLNNRNPHD
ncbi:conserved hypothetical protein [Xenorhabdus nematophila F1]|nr:conserved hypothetical protein [Xenorhabdus nematophila F1]